MFIKGYRATGSAEVRKIFSSCEIGVASSGQIRLSESLRFFHAYSQQQSIDYEKQGDSAGRVTRVSIIGYNPSRSHSSRVSLLMQFPNHRDLAEPSLI